MRWAAIFAPARIVDGALAAVRHQAISVDLVGRADAIRGRAGAASRRGGVGGSHHRCARCHRHVRVTGACAQAQTARLDSGCGRARGERRSGGARERRTHWRRGRRGTRGVRHARVAWIAPRSRRPSRRATASAVLIDAGATVDCKPSYLLQFAVMGAVYARDVARRRSPARWRCCRLARKRRKATI